MYCAEASSLTAAAESELEAGRETVVEPRAHTDLNTDLNGAGPGRFQPGKNDLRILEKTPRTEPLKSREKKTQQCHFFFLPYFGACCGQKN